MTETRLLDDRYEVGALIGRGGMADVHRGRDTRLGREVAIKLLRRDLARDPMFQTRFRREAQAVAGLNHPAIVSVYDTGEEQLGTDAESASGLKVPFIVMEYVDGRTLRDLLASDEVSFDQAVDYALGVLSALSYSHRMSIVHRDIKPANVMVTADGSIKVMDFGIARALADSAATMTQTQAVVGTAQYLSPEQARGENVDVRSDLYSAGCLLFELLTGRPPFVGDSAVSVAYQHVGEDALAPSALNDDVPAAFDPLLAKALQKDRENRFQDAAAFAHALREAREGVPYSDDPAEAPTQLIGTAAAAAGLDESEAATEALSLPSAETSALPTHDSSDPTVAMTAAAPHATTPEDSWHEDSAHEDSGHTIGAHARERSPYEKRRRRAWIIVFTLVTLLVVGGGGWFVWNWSQQIQAQNVRVEVPAVEGMTQTDAQNALLAENLRIAEIVEEFSDDVESGFAIGTRPGEGESLRVDSAVVLLISKGPSSVTIPDLAGATESSARATLEELGLEVETEMKEENSATVPADRVIRTNPAAGDPVAGGSTVELTLSTGMVSVPDLLSGLTVEEAEELLSDPAYGLNITVNEVENAVVSPGTIVDQSPEPGNDIEQGGTVTVDVAVAPPSPTPSPTPTEEESEEPSESPSADESPSESEAPSESPSEDD
ncbi:Stk1 family PASTA domain-containing Ser/Thr kinase [Zhihengliuella halotolerans]|uniref:non-specific serine/threonine protein kinase n=1 Tax=Zhihengliuella halotolerans TaxID=370736 RepID=A0A4Q8AH27_9MICC|nr:Stk1 family PASTA domain-containing Ser/Thr kinase [Zhihengliuella halotolerans]RZU63181.1 serine/threonine-protein kinase [Zhihengliuella halotolerans]